MICASLLAPSALNFSDADACESHYTFFEQIEADAGCRSVREALTFLNLNAQIRPMAPSSRHAVEQAALQQPPPILVDGKAGVTLSGAEQSCAHLFAEYGAPRGISQADLPDPTLGPIAALDWLPSLLRANRGASVEPGVQSRPSPPLPLILYSYDGNQFCRLVREVLTELDLPYELKSAGKGSPRRAELQALCGKTTCPYLVDPNDGGRSMGESADIVDYLYEMYG